jgi:broad specificity phosphatase PhoE
MKKLFLIRHGYAIHNQLFYQIGKSAYNIRDTQLLDEGIVQARKLSKTWKELSSIDLIICSPSIRTLDTALLIFQNSPLKIIAKDFLLEYEQGSQLCNRRKDIEDLKVLYPQVDFSDIKNNVLPWSGKKETIAELNNRINQMINWIKQREETNIAIVSHSSFIGHYKDGVIGDEKNQLKYCHPYQINLV